MMRLQEFFAGKRPRAAKKARSRYARRRAFAILVWNDLLRPTGHCRQHAVRMVMVVPAMLGRRTHLY
jgi:hypothetical protein